MSWTEPLPEPDLPPVLAGRRVVHGTRPLEAAVAGASAGSLGAGDALWNCDETTLELAIVLEPDVPIRQAAQMLPLALVAAGDCIGALAPPQVGVMFRWPGTILVNGAPIGDIEVVACSKMDDEVPHWLVVGLSVRMRFVAAAGAEPGHTPDQTAFAEEGGEDISPTDLIASYSRHFLTWLHVWQDEGFAPVHRAWMERAYGRDGAFLPEGHDTPVSVIGMDEHGDLIARDSDGATQQLSLLGALRSGDRSEAVGLGSGSAGDGAA